MFTSRLAWVSLVLVVAASATARPEFLRTARQAFHFREGGVLDRAKCSLCHASPAPPDLNPFGAQAYKSMRRNRTDSLTPLLLRSLLSADADGDGYQNGEEIAADTLPGDARSHPKRHFPAKAVAAVENGSSQTEENPFSPSSIFLARHAQHPVIVHFPIALFIVSLVLDFVAWAKGESQWAWAAKLNLQIAAGTSLLTIASGLLAWRLKFGGVTLSGILLYHLVGGLAFAAAAWAMLAIRKRRGEPSTPGVASWYLGLAGFGLFAVVVTGHLGGVLSGVAG